MRISQLNLVCIIWAVAICLVLCACGDSAPPADPPKLNLGLRTMTGQNVDQEAAPATNNATGGPADGMTENAEAEAFEIFDETKLYRGSNKINPFLPLIKSETGKEPADDNDDGERRGPQTPLEKFDIGQLKLSAVVETAEGHSAIIVESSGRGYVVRPGFYIGLNGGKIVEIKSDRVIIEEPIGKNERGEDKVNVIELILPKPAGAF